MSGWMSMRLLGAGAVLLASLAVAGCNTSTTSCYGNTCTVNATLDPGSASYPTAFNTRITVGNLTGDSVDVAVGGEQKTLRVGDRATMGGLTVVVDSINGNEVELTVTR